MPGKTKSASKSKSAKTRAKKDSPPSTERVEGAEGAEGWDDLPAAAPLPEHPTSKRSQASIPPGEMFERVIAPAIEKACTDSLISAGVRRSKSGELQPFGCGQFGCVYPHTDPKLVVKLTCQDHEARLAQLILDAQLDRRSRIPAGVPKIRDVRVVPCGARVLTPKIRAQEIPLGQELKVPVCPSQVYLIVREELLDVPQDLAPGDHRASFSDLLNRATALPDTAEDLIQFRRELLRLLPRQIKIVEDLMPAVRWFNAQGIPVHDIHSDNIGMRPDGTPVMRDFGLFGGEEAVGRKYPQLRALAGLGGVGGASGCSGAPLGLGEIFSEPPEILGLGEGSSCGH